MDLNLLPLFEAVARTASFSSAARELRMPKSSVSRGIARLEAELGVQLFFRTTRRVTVSAAGKELYDRVAPLLGSVKTALGELPERAEQPAGELRVTAPVDLGVLFLAEVVTRFTARYPAVSVFMNLTGRPVDLVAEGFDVALRVAPRLADSTLVARKAAPMWVGLFASPLYLARRGTPRDERDLAAHDWVAFRGQGTPRGRAPEMEERASPATGGGREAGASGEGRARIVCDDLLFARDVLRSGAGVGLLPAFVAEADLAAGTLVHVLPRYHRLAGHLYVVSPSVRHVPAKVTAFRDLVLELLRARPLGPAGI
ncbi:MAG TPA: LysR substrate-binding domain-containing protein [Myxococcales bacterium]|nr:LysR substrate-binding domain-containing protein [Myxococcales bacterium]